MEHYYFNNNDQSFVVDNQSFSFDKDGWHKTLYQSNEPKDLIATNNSPDDLERSIRKTYLWTNVAYDSLRHNLSHFIRWCFGQMKNSSYEPEFSIQSFSNPDLGFEIEDASLLNGAQPKLALLTGGPGQKFKWTGRGNIQCVHSNLFLTVDGSAITQETFRDNDSQLFQITQNDEILCQSYVFDIERNIITIDNRIIPYGINNGDNQKWFLRYSKLPE